MMGGGAQEAPAAATITNQKELAGGPNDVLLSDGTSKVGGTPTTVS